MRNRVCERGCERVWERLCERLHKRGRKRGHQRLHKRGRKRLSELTPLTKPTGQDSKNNLSLELEVKRTNSNRIPSTDTSKGIFLTKAVTNLLRNEGENTCYQPLGGK